MVLATEEAVAKHKMKPMARVVGWSSVGVDSTIMGFGPVPAIRNVFKATGISFKDMDFLELNEAFAAQALSCIKELQKDGLDINQVNPDGGAIAKGHPLGCTGTALSVHVVHELIRRNTMKYSLASACVGGGMGMAVVFEKC
jgi:acetyl-CoA acetyltransferase